MNYDQLWKAARIAADDEMYFGRDGEELVAYILCNDLFVPAADAEEVPWEDMDYVYRQYREKGYKGLIEWVAKRRGVPVPNMKDRA